MRIYNHKWRVPGAQSKVIKLDSSYNLGIGTVSPKKKLYALTWYWQVTKRKKKYYVEQISCVRMCLGADGSLSLGDGVMRSYEFQTKEWAQLMKERMEKMDEAFYS